MSTPVVLPVDPATVKDWAWDDKYDFPRDLIGYGEKSHNPKWPGGKKIAVSFVLNYEEGAERTVLNGDVFSETALWESTGGPARVKERAVNVESEYDYGSRAGVWRILRLFKKHNMDITLYGVGQALELNPDVAKWCVDEKIDVASHAYRWIDYHDFSVEEEKAYIKKGIEAIQKLTGEAPKGWYYGRLSPRSHALVWEVYKEMGLPLLWMSDSYADDVPYWKDVPAEKNDPNPEGMLMIPYSYDVNDFKYSQTAGGFSSPTDFYDHAKGAFDTLYAEGCEGSPKMMTIGLHCRVIGKPARFSALKKFVEYVESHEDVWVTSRTSIAEHFRKEFPYKKGQLA